MTTLFDSAPVRGRRDQGVPQDAAGQGARETGAVQAASSRVHQARQILHDQAFLISLLASVPAVFVLMMIFNINALYKDVAASLASGNLSRFQAVAIGVLFALLSSLAVGYIRESKRSKERDEAADRRQSTMLEKVDDVSARLDRLESQKRAVTFTGPNTSARWKTLYPGSVYWTINPFGRFDFIDEPQADGSVVRVPDWQRLSDIYIPRFEARTRLRSYNIVVFVQRQTGKSRVPEQIKYVLNLFRAIEFAARATGVAVDLSIVRLYVREAAEAQVSFFVGEMDINGRPVPFANQYVSMTKSFNVGRIVLDDRLITTFDRTEVDAFRATAEQLCFGVPALSIEEAEAKWGQFVPRPAWRYRDVSALARDPSATADDGIIDLGDGSFYIP